MTARSLPSDSSTVMLTLARLWLSLAEHTVWMTSTPASTARTAPLSLGTSAAYTVPGRRLICAITASASLRAGIAFGDTNDVTSILGSPVADSRSTTSTLRSVGIQSGSIWNPSRVPTSQMSTRLGSFMLASPCRPGWRPGSPAERERAPHRADHDLGGEVSMQCDHRLHARAVLGHDVFHRHLAEGVDDLLDALPGES